jgi:hypothetical protein
MARPKKEINWTEVEKRIEMGQKGIQIANCLRIDTDTFYRRFKQEYEERFEDYTARLTPCASDNILFLQYVKAMQGNIKMLELLGQEWCGQGKGEDINKKDLVDKFKKGMSQLLSELSAPISELSAPKIEDSNISNETKS